MRRSGKVPRRSKLVPLLILALFVASAVAAAPTQAPTCLRVLSPLMQGTIAHSEAFARVACSQAVLPETYAYDSASGATRLVRDLAAGEVVREFPDYASNAIQPGDRLTLVLAIGDVRVARDVEVLQRAEPGQSLFVRTLDGSVLSARYESRP